MSFRVVVRHTDKQHPNRAWFQFRDPLPEREFTGVALQRAREEFPEAGGYEHRVQELVVAETGEDDAGGELASRHRWRDVKGA